MNLQILKKMESACEIYPMSSKCCLLNQIDILFATHMYLLSTCLFVLTKLQKLDLLLDLSCMDIKDVQFN